MAAKDQYSTRVLKAVSKSHFNAVEGGVEETHCHEWTVFSNPIKLIMLSRSDMKLWLLKLVLTGSYLRGPTLTVVCSFILRVWKLQVLAWMFWYFCFDTKLRQMLQHLVTLLRPLNSYFLILDDIRRPTLRLWSFFHKI